jgi:F-type H+-transporting ATPase subunit b
MSSAEEPSASHSVDFLGKVINFMVLFGGLVYLLRKPLVKFLQGRADSLQRSMQEARDSLKKAELKLKEVESRLEKLDEEVKKIRQTAENEGADLHKSIVQETNREAGRLRDLARQEIERLAKAGVLEIREHMANLATDLALRNISVRMTGDHQSSLIDRSIDRLEKLYEKPNADQKIRAGSH